MQNQSPSLAMHLQKTMPWIATLTLSLLAWTTCQLQVSAERRYDIFELTSEEGALNAWSINNDGQVTGELILETHPSFGPERAFIWERSELDSGFQETSTFNSTFELEVEVNTSDETIRQGEARLLLNAQGTSYGYIGTVYQYPWSEGESGWVSTRGTVIGEGGAIGGTTVQIIGPEPLRINDGPIDNFPDVLPGALRQVHLGNVVGVDESTNRWAFENGYTWVEGDAEATQPLIEANNMRGSTVVGATGSSSAPQAATWDPLNGVVNWHPMVEARLGVYSSIAIDVTDDGHVVGVARIDEPFDPGPIGPSSGTLSEVFPADFEIPGPGDGPPGPLPGEDPEDEPPAPYLVWAVDPAPGNIGPPDVKIIGYIDDDLFEQDQQRLGGFTYRSRGVTAVNNHLHALGTVQFFDDNNDLTGEGPVLWRDRRTVEVQELIPDDSGWSIQHVSDINDRGEIVGHGLLNGERTSFLMRPNTISQYSQLSTPWGSQELLNGGTSIAFHGCFLTSAAMILDHYGHTISPEQLNNYLSDNAAFADPTSSSFSGGNMLFGSMPLTSTYDLPGADPGLVVAWNHETVPTSTRAQKVEQLADLIGEHGPVIIRVPYYDSDNRLFSFSNGTHAIVAYRVDPDGTIWVRNPGSEHSGTTNTGGVDTLTLTDYLDYENNRSDRNPLNSINHDLSWMNGNRVTYATVVDDGDSSIRGVVASPVELLIVDPLGRRLGFDPTANNGLGEFYNEIPGSSYARSYAVASQDSVFLEHDGFQPIDFIIGDIADGDYQFFVYSVDAGDWSVNLGLLEGLNYDPIEMLVSGTALGAGEQQSFQFHVAANLVPEPTSLVLILATLCMPVRRFR